MTTKIGKRAVLAAMKRVIKQHDAENKTYSDILVELGMSRGDSCVYKTPAGDPACFVGQVVIGEFGIDLNPYAGSWATTYSSEIIKAREKFTPKANEALRAAQQVQDGTGTRGTWGEAYKAATAV